MSFGDQLKKRREELGLSRSELADRLGVSRRRWAIMRPASALPRRRCCCGCSMPFMWSPTICIGMPTGAGRGGQRRGAEPAGEVPTVGPLRAPDPPHRGGCAGDHAAGAAGRRPGALRPVSSRCIAPRLQRAMPPRYSGRIMSPCPSPVRSPQGRSWRCGSRATPWSPISTTARWCT